jgi:hypothetical protein
MKIFRTLTLLFLCAGSFSFARGSDGSDNRYCGPGNDPKFGSSDGPAALPQTCFYTALSATPSPGKVIHVPLDSSLQQAIDKAECGDILELSAGSVYRGEFNFSAKRCDDRHWITVRTSGEIPPEGTRISPCYAGLRSLPARPDFPCPSPAKALATLIVPSHGSLTVTDHYRFIGLEITREEGNGIIYNLVTARAASKLIFDRVWMHGTANDETTRGFAFPGASFVAVIDSYFSDFHCIARTGSCVDSQAVWAGAGPVAGGTYKIVNNYLEAAAEGVLMGGGAANATPQDIEIRRNHFYKPLSWNHLSPQFNGSPFIVKNNLELKNASRVLVEANLLENSWGGFSQNGFQILLTPKSQENKCPLCVVRDVTIRYCLLRHSGSGMQLANAASDAGGLSQGLMNVSIHDVLMDDINARRYEGSGVGFQISTSGSTFRDLAIRHITVPFSDRHLFIIGGDHGAKMQGVTIADNILEVGQYQIMSTGGRTNCAFGQRDPKNFFDSCWPGYTFKGNLLVGGFDRWPEGNYAVKNIKALGFSMGNDDTWGYQLPTKSQYQGKATDAKAPGADISTIKLLLHDVP